MTSLGTPARTSSGTFGIRVNLELTATLNLLEVLRRVRVGGAKIHQRGGSSAIRILPRRYFYALLTDPLYRSGKPCATMIHSLGFSLPLAPLPFFEARKP